MADSLHVALAAGGTAGHINPALALADELRSRGHEVTFFGQPTRLEATLVPEAGYDFVPIEVTGFDRSRPWTGVTALVNMRRAQRAVGERFATAGAPDVAVGFGAYVEMALLRWCARAGVPYVIHEQNSVPGLANKLCAKRAARLCLSFPAAEAAFAGRTGAQTQVVVTGNPVRRSVIAGSREAGRAAYGIGGDELMLLVFGGSLGAAHLNSGMAALKDRLLAIDGLRIVHSTGAKGLDDALAALALTEEEAARWQVVPYIDAMGDALAAADLVLSRAGASSIAEIAALAVPSMLVPYPFATENHQETNAHLLADAGAAVICADDAIDTPEFADDLLGLLGDSGRREAMREAAHTLDARGAASILADNVEAAAHSSTEAAPR